MTITLQKRQFISLSKQAPNRLTKIMCGLGWDVGNEIQQEQFYDLDTFAICFNAEKQFTDRKNIIYFSDRIVIMNTSKTYFSWFYFFFSKRNEA